VRSLIPSKDPGLLRYLGIIVWGEVGQWKSRQLRDYSSLRKLDIHSLIPHFKSRNLHQRS